MVKRFGGICGAVLCVWSAVAPVPVFAAQVLFDAPYEAVRACDTFVVHAVLRPDGESLNAIEGGMAYPADLVSVVDIRDADSAVHFWLERPAVGSPGNVRFSGIVPGGFARNQEMLFSVVFQAKKPGRGDIRGTAIHVLKNDGAGTNSTVTTQTRSITVVGSAGTCTPPADTRASASSTAYMPDTVPPESFNPSISRSKDVFDGSWFLAFATQDKGSGMDHYAVREGPRGSFVTAESPYLLTDQSLHSDISVKAFDRAGNERLARIPQEKQFPWWYTVLGGFGILLLGGIIIFIRRK